MGGLHSGFTASAAPRSVAPVPRKLTLSTLDALRSTPPSCLGRDAVMFPEAEAARTAQGCPTRYCLAVFRARVTIVLEDFHLPHFVADALRARYAAYVDAWEREHTVIVAATRRVALCVQQHLSRADSATGGRSGLGPGPCALPRWSASLRASRSIGYAARSRP